MSEQTAATEKIKGLIPKLCEVMGTIDKVIKHGKNTHHNYTYATEADLVAAERGELSSRNIFIFPSVVNHSRTGQITDIMVSWTFVDGDTGETHECLMPGCGSDNSDKGVYKALTGSLKYLLMKSLLIPTGDDPEKDSTDDRKNGVKAAQAVATAKLRSEDGSEILNITPYMQGFAALSGSGLSLVRANMDDAMRGKFGWVQKGNVFMIPVEKVPALLEFCTFHSISALNEVPAVAVQPEQKPNGHAPVTPPVSVDDFKKKFGAVPFADDASTDPLILSAKTTTKNGRTTMWIKWNGHEISTFDKDLFPHIKANTPAMLEFKENGKYKNLTHIVRLAGKDFVIGDAAEPSWIDGIEDKGPY